jgi:ubiquinone/menaquinone biosynthesis C-methylase UbiE
MSTLEHLKDLGWVPPSEATVGVRYRAPADKGGISFPSAAYEDLPADLSDPGFYLSHRADVVMDLLIRLKVSSLWEIGAGNGNVAIPLTRAGLDVVAVEPLESGAEASARQGVTSICATLEQLRLPDASLPAVGMFDVLEHLRDPAVLLREVHRVLEPGGILVVTVPAERWLWSNLDEALGHFRRYQKGTLFGAVVPIGFHAMTAEYIYVSLVPVAAILRALPYRLGRRSSRAQVLAKVQQELNVTPAVDKGARLLLRAERRLAKVVSPPLGLSIVAAFRKADSLEPDVPTA